MHELATGTCVYPGQTESWDTYIATDIYIATVDSRRASSFGEFGPSAVYTGTELPGLLG
jgi:hypothetical protein